MRYPIVAGTFYPRTADEIENLLTHFETGITVKRSYGVVSPHAGYIYSGSTALLSISSVDYTSIDTVVLLGPNHTGLGRPIAVSLDDWETPLGTLKNDVEFGKTLIKNFEIAEHDEIAHSREHSIEVQLPILQYVLKKRNQSVKIVPICMLDQSFNVSQNLAEQLIKTTKDTGRNIMIIASSDCSHYVPADWAEKRDREAIGYLLQGDPEGFDRVRRMNHLTFCGYGPIITLTTYAIINGFGGAELLKYTHSGIITGDYTEVVGYAAIRFLKP